eukprot:NODE_2039_length_516_cov_574.944325_g1663_i0.p1 GENE.NODE_2039_length_516_cov_574.944325_g1663_i0~~NODE_2039_length_516_cov_574.944325_g1663_i0.p1  ORF type:complete len:147 (-),score=34.70 NODE_2039_length_516_cov_574.944325_g1663_i0:75-485(-)
MGESYDLRQDRSAGLTRLEEQKLREHIVLSKVEKDRHIREDKEMRAKWAEARLPDDVLTVGRQCTHDPEKVSIRTRRPSAWRRRRRVAALFHVLSHLTAIATAAVVLSCVNERFGTSRFAPHRIVGKLLLSCSKCV